jgi:hypothetical protein
MPGQITRAVLGLDPRTNVGPCPSEGERRGGGAEIVAAQKKERHLNIQPIVDCERFWQNEAKFP